MTASFPPPTEPASDCVPGAESAAAGLTPVERGNTRPDGTGTLRDDLVELITARYPLGRVWPTECHADQIADAILAAGFVRVSEDDATVERVAQALAESDGYDWGADPDREITGRSMGWDFPPGELFRTEYGGGLKPEYRRRARAAVRALREADE